MAKLKLDIDTLDVQSFETAIGERSLGTVRAHGGQYTEACGSWEDSCTAAYYCTQGGNTVPAGACQTNWYEVCPMLPPKQTTDIPA